MVTLEEKAKAVPKPPKALVKEFFDLDSVLKRHLEARLPFISNALMKISQVYTSKDKLIHRYRINWIETESGKICLSHYVEMIVDIEGNIINFSCK